MTEREKIIEIINYAKDCTLRVFCEECEYNKELNNYPAEIWCSELRIADALIKAGFGDIREAEHRAKTLERAFRDSLAEYLTAVNEANSYDCGIPEMFGRYANVLPYEDKVTNLLNKYLQQAEKELAEEVKE